MSKTQVQSQYESTQPLDVHTMLESFALRLLSEVEILILYRTTDDTYFGGFPHSAECEFRFVDSALRRGFLFVSAECECEIPSAPRMLRLSESTYDSNPGRLLESWALNH